MILSLGFEQQEQGNLIDMDDGPNQQQRMNTQILIEEDDTIQQLQERERSIRQLEVTIDFLLSLIHIICIKEKLEIVTAIK